MPAEKEIETFEEDLNDEIDLEQEEEIYNEEEMQRESDDEEEDEDEPGKEDDGQEENGDEEECELTITIGDEEIGSDDDKGAPSWVKEVRANNRELKRKVRELEQQLSTSEHSQQSIVQLPEKPKLVDFDFDDEKYDAAIGEWYETKRKHDEQLAKQKQEAEEQNREWQKKHQRYVEQRDALNLAGFDDAEMAVESGLSSTQQGLIVAYADKPALVVYAIGKNKQKMNELAAISDPVLFAIKMKELEKDMKVSRRKPSAQPEKKAASGDAGSAKAVSNTLERLREEAAKTGDFSKVVEYKRRMKKK